MHGEYNHTKTVMNLYPAKVNSNNAQSLEVVGRGTSYIYLSNFSTHICKS